MKNISGVVNKLTLIAFVLFLTGFAGSKNHKFEFKFYMHDIQSFVPSYQIAIWLETPDSSYVRTLFLSEYLSYGGYNLPEICSEWSSKAGWDEVTKEEFDAVTAATPPVGDVQLKLLCPAELLPEAKYLLFVEVHLAEEYNELYSCELELTGKKRMTELNVKYIPGKYPKKTEGDILTGVQVISK